MLIEIFAWLAALAAIVGAVHWWGGA